MRICAVNLLIELHMLCCGESPSSNACPVKVKRKFSFHHGAYQIFSVCSCNFTGISLNHIKQSNLICCCCFWHKVMAPMQDLDMNSTMLWSLSGDWTVERSGLLNSWVGLKFARFDISSGSKKLGRSEVYFWFSVWSFPSFSFLRIYNKMFFLFLLSIYNVLQNCC